MMANKRKIPILYTLIVFLTLSELLACSFFSLNKKGDVKLWTSGEDASISAVADSLTGLKLSLANQSPNWRQQLSLSDNPDLFFIKLSNDFILAKNENLLLEFTDYWSKLRSSKRLSPGIKNETLNAVLGGNFFLPATIQLWGLWYNKDLIKSLDIAEPNTLRDLEAAFAKVLANGQVPLALGAKSGWTATAWISALDLRYNGTAAYQKFFDGSRHFDDPSLLSVYAVLAKWRNQGWIDPEASESTWTQALAKVEKGQAAFLLMSSYAANRFRNADSIGFMSLPGLEESWERAELAVFEGFLVASNAKAPEAALALADTYVASACPDRPNAIFRASSVPVNPSAKKGEALQTEEVFQEAQALIRDNAKIILPQAQDLMPSQSSYVLERIITRFFSPEDPMDALALSQALKGLGLQP